MSALNASCENCWHWARDVYSNCDSWGWCTREKGIGSWEEQKSYRDANSGRTFALGLCDQYSCTPPSSSPGSSSSAD